MELHRWTRVGAGVLLAGLAGVACEDTLGPTGDFDPQSAAQAMESMVAAVDTGELANAFGSLEAAGGLFSGGTALLLGNPAETDGATLHALADEGLSADVLPPEHLGSVFVWSESEGAYVPGDGTVATDRIRVVYYAIDPTTGQPASPLNALGYVDLIEMSTMASNRLGVQVVRTGDTDVMLADYYLDVAFTITQSSLTIDVAALGWLSNGTDQLNFDLAQGLSATDTQVSINQAYSLDLEGTDNAITFTATLTGDPQSQSDSPQSMDAVATVTDGSQSVRMEIAWDGEVLDGTVLHNTVPVVQIGGTLEAPEFTNMNGDPLTEDQVAALQRVWEAFNEMFEFVEGLFGFAT